MATFGLKVHLFILTSLLLFGLLFLWHTTPGIFFSTSQIEAYFSSPGVRETGSPGTIHFKAPPGNDIGIFGYSKRDGSGSPVGLSEDVEPTQNSEIEAPGSAPGPQPTPAPAPIIDFNYSSDLTISNIPIAPEPEVADDKPFPPPRVPIVAQQDEEELLQEDSKYMFPLLSSFVGTGNQLMEYKSAAVIARATNRTLCLSPFFGGPSRHFGYLGNTRSGLYVEERYDIDDLSKFVKVASLHDCLVACNRTIEDHWRLRQSRPFPLAKWFSNFTYATADFDRECPKWTSPGDILHSLGARVGKAQKCVGMGGLFPGLRWRGAYWSVAAYLPHSKKVRQAADTFQKWALGTKSFIAVHWRFEESFCNGHVLGLCFARCGQGEIIGGGLASPRFADLPAVVETLGTRTSRGVFVGVTKEDVAAAIYDRGKESNVEAVYLSTDGWLRGNGSTAVLKWRDKYIDLCTEFAPTVSAKVVEELRRRGMLVVGLWNVAGLPNFSDRENSFVNPGLMPKIFGIMDPKEKVNNHMIAIVEQEICVRSVLFLGSGQSSWSLAVFDQRQSQRRRTELTKKLMGTQDPKNEVTMQAVDQKVVENLMADKHTAGPTCRGSKDAVPETYENEEPDGWLDFEACERRIDRGGKCVKLVSIKN